MGIYRRENDSMIIAEGDGEKIELGIKNPTVSRKRGSNEFPIEILPEGKGVKIRNNSNQNGIEVSRPGKNYSIPKEGFRSISKNSTIYLGPKNSPVTAKLQLTIQKESETISIEELERKGMERDGNFVSGSISSQATLISEVLKSKKTPKELLKYVREAQTLLCEHKTNQPDYKEVLNKAEKLKKRLDTKLSGTTKRELDQDWIDEIELFADHLEKLYIRSKEQ